MMSLRRRSSSHFARESIRVARMQTEVSTTKKRLRFVLPKMLQMCLNILGLSVLWSKKSRKFPPKFPGRFSARKNKLQEKFTDELSVLMQCSRRESRLN